MAQLPTGTVTFLFSDIEGSTRLLEDLGERYAAVRDEHAAIVRKAIADGDGVEVSTEGDSFFVAFATPGGAVRAAVSAQRGLHEREGSSGEPVRVRMGLHTGEGTLGGENYVGLDVNRAARVAGAAHGGQVILTGATRALVEPDLPEGVSLRDLGEHRLRDISRPERLHDLAIEGLPADFPPPRTLDARPNNLPPQLTSFVGREEEIAEARELVGRSRLVTLTGPGGTGKTRLAIQLASEVLLEHRDGAFFVDLSSVADPALVPSAIARAMNVSEEPGRPLLESVTEHLRDRELLLVLDNFEQVVEAGPVVEDLLTAAPGVTVVVTSRVILGLRGEHEYTVPPLNPPDTEDMPALDALRSVEAVRLFTERALAADPRFRLTEQNAPAVAGITARLDGLPLAIELAATRTKVLSPEQILPRLEDSLSILTTGARTMPERQRTLRGAIAWSHDLLELEEQRLFAQLAVFTGGWTLESAETVCPMQQLGLDPLDGVSSLVDKSLIRRIDPNGHPRFTMLETIREFALERLREEGDLDAARRRHGEHFLDLALEAEPHLTSEDQLEWLERCEVEHANIRAALRWAIEADLVDRAQGAAGALWRFWQQRGHLDEGRRWLEEILAMPSGRAATPARAKALIGAGGVAWWRKDREASRVSYEEAVAIERELGDPTRIAEALYNLAFVVAGDDIGAASELMEESLGLSRQVGNERGVAQAQAFLVIGDAEAGRWKAVLTRLEEVGAIWRRLGDRLHLAFDTVWLAFAHGKLGHREEARAAALEALEIFREADNTTGIGIVLVDLAFLATWEGRHEDAIRLAGAFDTLREQVGGPPGGFAGLLEGDPADEARPHLSEDAARRAWDEGTAMTVDEAIALARRGPGA
jgi:predicted ATPase/class 3 adenylate cyclase